MLDQLSLFDEPTTTPDKSHDAASTVLTCAFGRPWPIDSTWNGPGHCEQCHAYERRLQAQFEAALAAGRYNARGFTKNEWATAGHPPQTFAEARD